MELQYTYDPKNIIVRHNEKYWYRGEVVEVNAGVDPPEVRVSFRGKAPGSKGRRRQPWGQRSCPSSYPTARALWGPVLSRAALLACRVPALRRRLAPL